MRKLDRCHGAALAVYDIRTNSVFKTSYGVPVSEAKCCSMPYGLMNSQALWSGDPTEGSCRASCLQHWGHLRPHESACCSGIHHREAVLGDPCCSLTVTGWCSPLLPELLWPGLALGLAAMAVYLDSDRPRVDPHPSSLCYQLWW